MMRAVNPPGAGIPGISAGMLIESGRLLVLSGHVPMGSDGAIVGHDHASQLDQVFRNMAATLEAAGLGVEALARVTIYVRDYTPALLPDIRAVRDRWLGSAQPPASALIGVAALFREDVLVEVDGLAAS